MKDRKDNAVKLSDTDAVDFYMDALKHPLKNLAGNLRKIILAADEEIGEEIKWNAPAFFYKGKMKPFNPKEYKRHIIVFNFAKKDCIRLVFPSGAKMGDVSGLLQGNYADGRRLAIFSTMEDIKVKQQQLQSLIRIWLDLLEK